MLTGEVNNDKYGVIYHAANRQYYILCRVPETSIGLEVEALRLWTQLDELDREGYRLRGAERIGYELLDGKWGSRIVLGEGDWWLGVTAREAENLVKIILGGDNYAKSTADH